MQSHNFPNVFMDSILDQLAKSHFFKTKGRGKDQCQCPLCSYKGLLPRCTLEQVQRIVQIVFGKCTYCKNIAIRLYAPAIIIISSCCFAQIAQ